MSHRMPVSTPQVFRPAPPLPDPIEPRPSQTPSPSVELSPRPQLSASPASLRSGCYLINYTPTGASLVSYDGTLRVDKATGELLASGDLYQRDTILVEEPPSITLAPPPDPAAGIPIFPIESYRYYLRVTRILEIGGGFSLAFETHRFSVAEVVLLDGSRTAWPKESALTALMALVPARAGYPSPDCCFAGDVTRKKRCQTCLSLLMRDTE